MHPYVVEQFTDEESADPPPLRDQPRPAGLRPGQPARGGEGRPVRAVLAQPQVPPPALPRRVRGRPRRHRRRDVRRDRRASSAPRSSTSASSSSTATTRSPSSAGCTSRASSRPTCSPRSSSVGRLMSYLEQSTRYIPYDQRTDTGHYRYYRPPERARLAARRALRGRPRPHVRHLRRAALDGPTWLHARYPKAPGDSDFVHRQAIRAKALDAVRGVLPAASLSNVGIYGTGQGYEQLLLRMRAHPLARGARVRRDDAHRAAQGHPVVPAPRRRRGPGGGVVRVPRDDPRGRPGAPSSGSSTVRRRATRTSPPRCGSWTSTPTGRTRCSPRRASRTSPARRPRCSPGCARSAPSERTALLEAYVGDRQQPPPPSGARLRAHGLPLRARDRLRRVPRPAATPAVHDRVAGRSAARSAPRSPRPSSYAGWRGVRRHRSRAPSSSTTRSRRSRPTTPATPSRSRSASATCCR